MQLILSTVDFLFHAYTDIFLLILFLRDLKIKYRYLFAKDTVSHDCEKFYLLHRTSFFSLYLQLFLLLLFYVITVGQALL